MNNYTKELFCELFHTTDTDTNFNTIDDLHSSTGMSLYQIRNSLEDLKELGYIIEEDRGIQVTSIGRDTARSLWVD